MGMKRVHCTIEDMLGGAEKTGVIGEGNADLQTTNLVAEAKDHIEHAYDRLRAHTVKSERIGADNTRQRGDVVSHIQLSNSYE